MSGDHSVLRHLIAHNICRCPKAQLENRGVGLFPELSGVAMVEKVIRLADYRIHSILRQDLPSRADIARRTNIDSRTVAQPHRGWAHKQQD